MFGKPKPSGSGSPSQAIEVLNLQENTKTSYNFISEATIALNIPFQLIYSYLTRNQKKPYKKQYIFKKV
jgi:hypothetical protein